MLSETISVKKDGDSLLFHNEFGPVARAQKGYGGYQFESLHHHENQHPEVKHIFSNFVSAANLVGYRGRNKISSAADAKTVVDTFSKSLVTESPWKEHYHSSRPVDPSDPQKGVKHLIAFKDKDTDETHGFLTIERSHGDKLSVRHDGKVDYSSLPTHSKPGFIFSKEFNEKHGITEDVKNALAQKHNNDPYKILSELKELVNKKPIAVGTYNSANHSNSHYSVPEGQDPEEALQAVHDHHVTQTHRYSALQDKQTHSAPNMRITFGKNSGAEYTHTTILNPITNEISHSSSIIHRSGYSSVRNTNILHKE